VKPAPPADLWEQMDAIVGVPKPNDPGISVKEFCQRYKVGDCQARIKIKKLVEEGKLLEGRRKELNGFFVRVYRPK